MTSIFEPIDGLYFSDKRGRTMPIAEMAIPHLERAIKVILDNRHKIYTVAHSKVRELTVALAIRQKEALVALNFKIDHAETEIEFLGEQLHERLRFSARLPKPFTFMDLEDHRNLAHRLISIHGSVTADQLKRAAHYEGLNTTGQLLTHVFRVKSFTMVGRRKSKDPSANGRYNNVWVRSFDF
jgi:hypothetical protein